MARKNVAQEKTLELPVLARSASFMPKTINDEARTADVIWTTGARVMRGVFDRYYEELSLDPSHVRMKRLNNGAPLLANHDGGDIASVIGTVESARIENGKGIATVRFAKAEDSPESDRVFRLVKDGILQNISVGYQTYRMEDVGKAKDGTPVYRATDWEPHEISVVPMGADDAAGFRSATRSGAISAPCVFVTRQQEQVTMADEDQPTNPPAQLPAISAAVAATQAVAQSKIVEAKQRAAIEEAARQDGMAKERVRCEGLREIGEQSGLGEEWTRKQIALGTEVEEARKIAWSVLVARDLDGGEIGLGGTRITSGDDARDKFIRGATAWMIERCGHTETIAKAKKVDRLSAQFKDVATDPGEFRGMRMTDLARFSLEFRGGKLPRGLHGDALIRRALELRASDQGFNTTSDFSVLLETAMNKIFTGMYALAPVTWPLWAGRKSVNDFRTSTFYRPGTFGTLDSLTEAGEIKHKNIPDGEKRTLTPSTKANIIGITRRALVNDDLGAFTNLGANLGLAAAFTVEADAFALITANSGLGINYDANPLFHSSRSNIGASGAMSVSTLDNARAVMRKQKDPSANQFLNLRPSVWLGPVELGSTMGQFNRSTTDPTDNKAQGVTNRVQNIVDTIVDSPYLSASSATRHYLLADPSLYPVFAVGFIDGQEAPRIETYQSFGFDGVQMKVVLDYGVAVLDYRGAVTAPGA